MASDGASGRCARWRASSTASQMSDGSRLLTLVRNKVLHSSPLGFDAPPGGSVHVGFRIPSRVWANVASQVPSHGTTLMWHLSAVVVQRGVVVLNETPAVVPGDMSPDGGHDAWRPWLQTSSTDRDRPAPVSGSGCINQRGKLRSPVTLHRASRAAGSADRNRIQDSAAWPGCSQDLQ